MLPAVQVPVPGHLAPLPAGRVHPTPYYDVGVGLAVHGVLGLVAAVLLPGPPVGGQHLAAEGVVAEGGVIAGLACGLAGRVGVAILSDLENCRASLGVVSLGAAVVRERFGPSGIRHRQAVTPRAEGVGEGVPVAGRVATAGRSADGLAGDGVDTVIGRGLGHVGAGFVERPVALTVRIPAAACGHGLLRVLGAVAVAVVGEGGGGGRARVGVLGSRPALGRGGGTAVGEPRVGVPRGAVDRHLAHRVGRRLQHPLDRPLVGAPGEAAEGRPGDQLVAQRAAGLEFLGLGAVRVVGGAGHRRARDRGAPGVVTSPVAVGNSGHPPALVVDVVGVVPVTCERSLLEAAAVVAVGHDVAGGLARGAPVLGGLVVVVDAVDLVALVVDRGGAADSGGHQRPVGEVVVGGVVVAAHLEAHVAGVVALLVRRGVLVGVAVLFVVGADRRAVPAGAGWGVPRLDQVGVGVVPPVAVVVDVADVVGKRDAVDHDVDPLGERPTIGVALGGVNPVGAGEQALDQEPQPVVLKGHRALTAVPVQGRVNGAGDGASLGGLAGLVPPAVVLVDRGVPRADRGHVVHADAGDLAGEVAAIVVGGLRREPAVQAVGLHPHIRDEVLPVGAGLAHHLAQGVVGVLGVQAGVVLPRRPVGALLDQVARVVVPVLAQQAAAVGETGGAVGLVATALLELLDQVAPGVMGVLSHEALGVLEGGAVATAVVGDDYRGVVRQRVAQDPPRVVVGVGRAGRFGPGLGVHVGDARPGGETAAAVLEGLGRDVAVAQDVGRSAGHVVGLKHRAQQPVVGVGVVLDQDPPLVPFLPEVAEDVVGDAPGIAAGVYRLDHPPHPVVGVAGGDRGEVAVQRGVVGLTSCPDLLGLAHQVARGVVGQGGSVALGVGHGHRAVQHVVGGAGAGHGGRATGREAAVEVVVDLRGGDVARQQAALLGPPP
ncbi:hypothetical protein Mterra_02057 [Calidithermus terrae]|uniref:Uncharacterized protein n=1 Tax=Calidithermus terrae TaxID=1408545 RepID=A0A399EHR8_9DEIN|nr:hypothetical protein Mterra_02057 [Calidithermus terrae]